MVRAGRAESHAVGGRHNGGIPIEEQIPTDACEHVMRFREVIPPGQMPCTPPVTQTGTGVFQLSRNIARHPHLHFPMATKAAHV
jgi:hypothetical protein